MLKLLSKFEIGILDSDDFRILTEKNSEKFEDSYHNYYISYVDLKTSLNEKLTSIYSSKEFTKIIVNFEPVKYNWTFIQEVEHLAFMFKYNALNEDSNMNNIIDDYNKFFSGYFLNHSHAKIKSNSIKTLYYLTRNFNKVFLYLFLNLRKRM